MISFYRYRKGGRIMLFLWSISIAFVCLNYGGKWLERRKGSCYLAVLFAAVLTGAGPWAGQWLGQMGFLEWKIPALIGRLMAAPFEKGTFALALFTLVMYSGTAKGRRMLRYRKQMAVMACILTLGHSAAYLGKTILAVRDGIGEILPGQIAASHISVFALLLMIPLFATSFDGVRRKMSPGIWKSLQKTAYLFYLLIYVHVMFLYTADLERWDYRVNVLVYTLVYGGYLWIKIRERQRDRREEPKCREKNVKRGIFLALAFLFLGIGAVGVVIPILPTTPFLLLASVLFAKSSKRFHCWFLSTKLYQRHLESFVTSRAMTMRTKLSILIPVSAMLVVALLLVPWAHGKLLIGGVLICKYYYFIFRIQTIPAVKKES